MGKREELEAKLIDNPSDADLRSVYADLLQSTGDPRGELIALMARGRTAEADAYRAQHEDARSVRSRASRRRSTTSPRTPSPGTSASSSRPSST